MEPDFAELEAEMAAQIASGLRPTLQVAVDWRGRRVFEKALGAGANVDSTYVLWSSTKPFVAVALLQLVEAGQLELDQRVATVIPEFGTRGKEKVTVAHLLTHRGGFPDTTLEVAMELAKLAPSWDAAIRFVCDLPLTWEPGSDRGYHPATGWYVVGELVQRLDDRPLPEALRARVLEPLAIPRDGFALGRPDDVAATTLPVQTRDAKGAPPQSQADYWNDPRTRGAVIPGAGGIARARSVAAFYRALLDGGRGANGRILSAEMVRIATFPHVVGFRDRTFLRDIPWGLGFHLKHVLPSLDDCGTRATPGTFGHGGHFLVNTGFADPGRDLAVAILSNGLAEPRAGMAAVTALADAIHAGIDRASAA